MQAELKYVPRAALLASADNVRKHHDVAKHAELVESLRQHGVITPLVVRPSTLLDDHFEVAGGHRRLQAATDVGLVELPVSIRAMDDRTFREVMLTDNLQRVDPDPLDEADAYQAMIDDLGYDVATLAAKFGKGETYVRARLVLTRLGDAARTALAANQIELGHAVLLARADEPTQDRLLETRILARQSMPPARFRVDPDETSDPLDPHSDDDYDRATHKGAKVLPGEATKTQVSIAELRSLMAESLLPLHVVKWDRDDATLVPHAGSCTACPKRTGANPSLFAELEADDDRCPDAVCYAAKVEAYLVRRVDAARSAAPNLVCITTKSRLARKTFGGDAVLREDKEWKTTKAGSRGSVPAIIVESDRYGMQAQWAELGELQDVKRIPKQKPTPKAIPGASTASTTAGVDGDFDQWGNPSRALREAWAAAEDRFGIGVAAVVAAMRDAAPSPATDYVPAAMRRALVVPYYEPVLPDELSELLATCFGIVVPDEPDDRREDDAGDAALEEPAAALPPLSARATQIVAAFMATPVETPAIARRPDARALIHAETGTFALPIRLITIARDFGVDAPTVWESALTSAATSSSDTTADAAAGVA